jgi:hypothetical protein
MFVAGNSKSLEVHKGKAGVKQREKSKSGRNLKRNGGEAVNIAEKMRSRRDDLR